MDMVVGLLGRASRFRSFTNYGIKVPPALSSNENALRCKTNVRYGSSTSKHDVRLKLNFHARRPRRPTGDESLSGPIGFY